MVDQPDAQSTQRRAWRKRILAFLLVLVSFAMIIFLIPSTTHYSNSGDRCSRCYASYSHYTLDVLGVRVIDRYRTDCKGTPELRTAQARCSQPAYTRHVYLRGGISSLYSRKP